MERQLIEAIKHLRMSEAGHVEMVPAIIRHIYLMRSEPLIEIDKWLESFRGMRQEHPTGDLITLSI